MLILTSNEVYIFVLEQQQCSCLWYWPLQPSITTLKYFPRPLYPCQHHDIIPLRALGLGSCTNPKTSYNIPHFYCFLLFKQITKSCHLIPLSILQKPYKYFSLEFRHTCLHKTHVVFVCLWLHLQLHMIKVKKFWHDQMEKQKHGFDKGSKIMLDWVWKFQNWTNLWPPQPRLRLAPLWWHQTPIFGV